MGPEETWALIARLATTLVRELEPQKLAHVEAGLFHIAARVTDTTDLEMVVPELIHLLGGDGKALRALKMVSSSECMHLCDTNGFITLAHSIPTGDEKRDDP